MRNVKILILFFIVILTQSILKSEIEIDIQNYTIIKDCLSDEDFNVSYSSFVDGKNSNLENEQCQSVIPVELKLDLDSREIAFTNDNCSPDITDQNIQDNLLLHYKLNGNALDESSNGFNGALINIEDAKDRFGNTSSSCQFDGTSSITLPENDILEPDYPISFSTWCKFEEGELWYPLFATNFDENNYHEATFLISKYGKVVMFIGNGNGSTGSTNRITIVSEEIIDFSRWNHVVAVLNGPDDFQVYINGCESETIFSSGTGTFEMVYSNSPGVIGRHNNSTNYFLKGIIDDLYFWDRAIEIEEVWYLYNEFDVPILNIVDSYVVEQGNSLTIEIDPSFEDVVWSNGKMGNSIVIMEAGEYSVEAYYNCVLVCAEFEVKEEMVFEQTCEDEYEGDLNQNLLLHYKLDGDAIDESINGFDGTIVGLSNSMDRHGENDKSVKFNKESKIILPENDILEPDYPFTVSCWSKVENSLEHNILFASDYKENDYNGAWVFVVPDGRVSIGIGNGNGSTGPGNRRSYVSTNKVNNNQWNHIVALFVGPEEFRLFINGCESEVTASGSGSFDISYTANSGVIGLFDVATDPNSGLYFFEGQLDDFYFWDRTITEEEILYLYDKFNIPIIIQQNEFALNGIDPVFVGANPVMTDVIWSDGTIGNIFNTLEPGIYRVEGYFECVLICDSFVVNQVVIEPEICDTITLLNSGCKHSAYECVLDQSNGGLKYFYEGHIALTDGTQLCNPNELIPSFNHGNIEIMDFENHIHPDGTNWISYSAYLFITDAELFEVDDSYISFKLCKDDESDICVSYLLPFKECYSDYKCEMIVNGVTANIDNEYVDVNYCMDLHEVIQDQCTVSAYSIEVIIYGDVYTKSIYTELIEGDFNERQCIKIPVLVSDFLNGDYNCLELYIDGDCPGISCFYMDCNVFFSSQYLTNQGTLSNLSSIELVSNIEEIRKKEASANSFKTKSVVDLQINVYPIPANDDIVVRYSSNKEFIIEIRNVLGQKILGLKSSAKENLINLSSVYSGVYYLSILENGQKVGTKRIVKI